MIITLTPRGIPFMFTSPPKVVQPLLQVIHIERIGGVISSYIISDSQVCCRAVLNPDIQDNVKDSMRVNAIIHLLSFEIVNRYQRIIMINDLYIAIDAAAKIGQPSPIQQIQENARAVVPISSLQQNLTIWTVFARVLTRTSLRHSKRNRDGASTPYFYFDVLDKYHGRIRVSCFGEEALQFNHLIQNRQVFMISGGRLVLANKEYNRLPHRYEIHANHETIIRPAADDGSIRMNWFNFMEVRHISSMPHDSTVDFLGLLVRVGEEINSPGPIRRTVLLEDRNGGSIKCTLFGSICEKEGDKLQNSGELPVIALESVRVDVFRGVTSLNTIPNSQI